MSKNRFVKRPTWRFLMEEEMDEIRTVKRKDFKEGFNELHLEVQLIAGEGCGRETQHLIEEKIDALFDEVGRLTCEASSRHTA